MSLGALLNQPFALNRLINCCIVRNVKNETQKSTRGSDGLCGTDLGGPYKRNQNPYKSDKLAPYIRYMTEIEKIEKELEMSKDRH